MPKKMTVKMEVPSGSRPPALLLWLNKLLAEHGMKITHIEEDQ